MLQMSTSSSGVDKPVLESRNIFAHFQLLFPHTCLTLATAIDHPNMGLLSPRCIPLYPEVGVCRRGLCSKLPNKTMILYARIDSEAARLFGTTGLRIGRHSVRAYPTLCTAVCTLHELQRLYQRSSLLRLRVSTCVVHKFVLLR
jgi:hypothetical protein